MGLDPYNCVVKIRESIGTLTPNMGVHLGVWSFIPSHSLHSREHVMWLRVFLLACNLATPCLGHKRKAKVVTILVITK
jgi:hypothetical protein